jgi:hypothetical protein
LVTASFAFNAGKASVQIAVIEITVDHLPVIGSSEALLSCEMIIINLNKGFKIVLYTTVIIG